MESNAHAGVSHPFGGPHRNMSGETKRTYARLFGYKMQPLNIKVQTGEDGERMYGKDIPCKDIKISMEELRKQYRDISPYTYHPKALKRVKEAQNSIEAASKATGVPEIAIAAALADENTAIVNRGEWVDTIVDSVGKPSWPASLNNVRGDYAEAVRTGRLHGDRGFKREHWTHDVGPGNFNVANGLELFEENVVNANSENHINKYLYQFIEKNASLDDKWEAYKKHMMLTMDGNAHLAAAEMQRGALKIAPYMENSTREEQAAILVTYYKQGNKMFLQRYLQERQKGRKSDIRAGEGARLFQNWDALVESLL